MKSTKYLLFLALSCVLLAGPLACSKETKGLKEEMKIVKEENSILKAENIVLKKELDEVYKKLEEKSAQTNRAKAEASDPEKAKPAAKMEPPAKTPVKESEKKKPR